MSSVRPILECEERHGQGEPLISFTAFFGLSAGVLTQLRMHGLTVKQNWFPNSKARASGFLFIGGGYIGGLLLGRFLFGDASLRRLSHHHAVNRPRSH